MEISFVGGSYEGKSKNLNAQVCQNLYPVVDQQGGKSVLGLYNVPGTAAWINLGEGNRYLVKLNSNLYFNKNVLTIPQLGYLIGWYKFNEGSGLIAYNSATDGSLGGGLLPNLDIAGSNPPGIFWSYAPGFGSVPNYNTVPPYDSRNNAYKVISPTRTLGPATNFGIFYKRSLVSNPDRGGYIFRMSQYLTQNTSGFLVWDGIYGGHVGNTKFRTPKPDIILYDEADVNSWYFYFFDSNGYCCAVRPDGTLVVASFQINLPFSLTFNVIYFCVGALAAGFVTSSCQGSFGDLIYYNLALLTRAQWAQWYDELRSRYGMAARNGW